MPRHPDSSDDLLATADAPARCCGRPRCRFAVRWELEKRFSMSVQNPGRPWQVLISPVLLKFGSSLQSPAEARRGSA